MNEFNQKKLKSAKKHICLECGVSFNRPYRLAQHLLMHQNIKSFVCGEKGCNKAYTNKSHLDRHIQSVHISPANDVIHRCPNCMKLFSNRQNLKKHIQRKHVKIPTFTCDVCNTDFKKKHQLSTHMYQHTFIKSFSCELCAKEFISLHDRKRHMRFHKTYECAQCDMVFNQWSKYQKHRRSEHHSREFICNECDRKFKERRHMVHHVKTHMLTEPKVYSCWYQDCNRVYSRHSNLKQHVAIKHMQLTHPCEICDARLSTQAKLRLHLQTHYMPQKAVKPPKTRETGRKHRKDKGLLRNSMALKIAGLEPAASEEIINTVQNNNNKECNKDEIHNKIIPEDKKIERLDLKDTDIILAAKDVCNTLVISLENGSVMDAIGITVKVEKIKDECTE